VVVRPITDRERDRWHCMRTALFPDMSNDDHEREIAHVLSDSANAQCFVALVDDKPVGFLEVRIREWVEGCASQNVGYLEAIYVDEFFRRSGVAKALIRAAEHWSRDHGAQEVASDADVDNEEGLALHHQMQYEEMGRSVLFTKKLDGLS